ncbi:hypothetical protein Zm00014a_005668 [Zea mays]|uniref:Uncharacterized protein n=1 Tax=Zea mays TaxID=4577 RepID=A0A3L6GBM8_MAIZE|nr:hypothetical protein Zm00014a_005668 [Zea mays]
MGQLEATQIDTNTKLANVEMTVAHIDKSLVALLRRFDEMHANINGGRDEGAEGNWDDYVADTEQDDQEAPNRRRLRTNRRGLQEMQVFKDTELDPYSVMIDDAMYDEGNPITDWLCNLRSESPPILDEYDDNELDSPIPSRVLMDELGMDGEVTALKRKLDFNTRDGKKKRKAGLVDIEEEMRTMLSQILQKVAQYMLNYVIAVQMVAQCNLYGLKVGDEFGDEWEFGGPSGGGACDVGASDDGSRDGAMHEQAAPNPPFRPRSTRLKKVLVKELYK